MSYELSGAKWGAGSYGETGGTVTWSADFGDALRFDSEVYDIEDFEAALGAAFDAWEAVADIDFLRVADASESVMDVSMALLSGSTVGYASTSFFVHPGVDVYSKADVIFDSGEFWAPYGDGGLDFHAVALHEIGHAIGLGHVADRSEIMNPVVSADHLGDGDIAGVQAIYGPADAPSGGRLTPPAPAPDTTPDPDAPGDVTAPPLGLAPSAPDEDDEGGGFDPFGWIFDLFSRLFGGGKDEEVASGAALEIGTDGHGVTVPEVLTPDEIDAWLAEHAYDAGHDEGEGWDEDDEGLEVELYTAA